jgi:hypothetical protein
LATKGDRTTSNIINTGGFLAFRKLFLKMPRIDKTRRVEKLRDRARAKGTTPQRKLKIWYKIGKILDEPLYKVKGICKEQRLGARRIYQYFSKNKEKRWEGPSPRDFGKMSRERFLFLLKGQEEMEGGTLLESDSNAVTMSRDEHMTNITPAESGTPTHEDERRQVTMDSFRSEEVTGKEPYEPSEENNQWELGISADDFLAYDWFNESSGEPTHADPCLPMPTHADPCLPMPTHADPCLPMPTH